MVPYTSLHTLPCSLVEPWIVCSFVKDSIFVVRLKNFGWFTVIMSDGFISLFESILLSMKYVLIILTSMSDFNSIAALVIYAHPLLLGCVFVQPNLPGLENILYHLPRGLSSSIIQLAQFLSG